MSDKLFDSILSIIDEISADIRFLLNICYHKHFSTIEDIQELKKLDEKYNGDSL